MSESRVQGLGPGWFGICRTLGFLLAFGVPGRRVKSLGPLDMPLNPKP